MKQKIKLSDLWNWCKKEAVLSFAFLLAIISAFIVHPDKEYIGYIDFRTLAILFCLMAVMAGLQQIGLFNLSSTGTQVLIPNQPLAAFRIYITETEGPAPGLTEIEAYADASCERSIDLSILSN